MKNDRTLQQRATVFIGILLVIATVGGAILPLLQTSLNNQQQTVRPTETPVPTLPAPPDTALINFEQRHLQASGLFSAAVPTGWTVTSDVNSSGEAILTMQNPTQLSVVEVRAMRPTADIQLDSPQNMGAYFTQAWVDSSWRQYTTKQETERHIEGEQLVMDFTLTQRGATYSARQIAYTDGTWIYAVRVVMPANATDALQYILNGEVASVQVVERFVGSPIEWKAYFDNVNKHLLRFPSTWVITDAANGAAASLEGANVQARIESASMGIASADAASAYVAGLRSGITVLSVEEVEQFGVTGYRVAYTLPSLDGPSASGLVLILNDGTTNHIANILLSDVSDTDLNTVDITAEGINPNIVDARNVLDTFSLLPELTVSN